MPPELSYDKVFRILIVQFMDVYSMDVRSVKKSCLHIVHPDGRMIPSHGVFVSAMPSPPVVTIVEPTLSRTW